jgi:aspartyl-tRNA(Asn)/glutamyl-tRNA(Gln) amidotransferase subunit C
MAAPHLDIRSVAHLARLELSADEIERYGAQLDDILRYFEQLKQVDVSGVEPMAHAMPLVNVTRPDAIQPSMPHSEALRNAPIRGHDLFVVPRIVE